MSTAAPTDPAEEPAEAATSKAAEERAGYAGEEPLDVLIVGGGPVGACLGALLMRAQHGRRRLQVALLEPATQAQRESVTQAQTQPGAEPHREPQTQPVADAQTEAGADVQTERGAQAGTEPVADAHAEAAARAHTEPALDARVAAFSRASEHILRNAGAWEHIEAFAYPYERMRVWHEGTPAQRGVLEFDAAEVGEPNLGYIIENQRVTDAFLREFTAAGGRIIAGGFEGARPIASSMQAGARRVGSAVEAGIRPVGSSMEAGASPAGSSVEVTTTAGPIIARLIVGADGARSAVRAAMAIAVHSHSYRQWAIVARVGTEHPHRATAWQRFVQGGTLAFLPLADGSSSIVWSVEAQQAQSLLDMPAPAFERELQHGIEDALGKVQLQGQRLAFPLHRLRAREYTATRCALVGDAAHVVHPLAGQGVNLGLLDAAALAQQLLAAHASGEDVGAQRVLRAYARWRKSENEIMELGIDAFNRFLAQGIGPLSRLARGGLRVANHGGPLKRFFMARALGVQGELPQAARPLSQE